MTILEHVEQRGTTRRYTYEVRYRDSAHSLSTATAVIDGQALGLPAAAQVIEDVLVGLLDEVGFPHEDLMVVVALAGKLAAGDVFDIELAGGYHDGTIRRNVPLGPDGFPPPTIVAPLPVSIEQTTQAGSTTVTYTRDRLLPDRGVWIYRT